MKKILTVLLLGFCSSAFSLPQFYTVSTTKVGPGVIHKKIMAPTVPWIINVLEVDLNNEYICLESVKANDRIAGYEWTSSMAARMNYEGHKVVGAINADFYASGGVPIGTQVINGEILKHTADWGALGFNINNDPFIGYVSFSGNVTDKSGSKYSVNNVNGTRGTDCLVVYNSYLGSATGTNEYGMEIQVTTLSSWIVNDTVYCVVDSIENGIGNMRISKGKAVLSGHGAAVNFLNSFQKSDTVKLVLNLQPSLPKLTQVVGGNLKILENGQYTGSTNADRHPRTFVGFSADSTKLFLATVDGRQTGSIGMTYREEADLMVWLGAYQAINLDGGGSTTMVIHNTIENTLFADERAVSNGLMLVSNAPEDTLNSIQVRPDNFRVFLGKSQSLKVKGWDRYFNPKPISSSKVSYSVDPALGSIDYQGLFTAVKTNTSGYILIEYEDMTDTAWVYIKTLKSIAVSPKYSVTDNLSGVQFKIVAIDEDDLEQSIPLTDFSWKSLNPEIGDFDSTATFYGISEGLATVVVTYLGMTDTAQVKIEIGNDVVVIDSVESIDSWSLAGLLYDETNTTLSMTDNPLTLGNNALQLNYQFIRSDSGRSWIYLNTDIPVYGLPDTIMFDFKSNPGDHKSHVVVLVISDDDGELFQASVVPKDTNFVTYKIGLDKFGQVIPNSSFHFPIRLKSIQIRLGYYGDIGDTNSGVLYLDKLCVKYPNVTTGIENESPFVPEDFCLFQNYPNPFNTTTVIPFRIAKAADVKLTVYNMVGNEVRTLVDERMDKGSYDIDFDATGLATGVYIYRLETNGLIFSKKMMFIK